MASIRKLLILFLAFSSLGLEACHRVQKRGDDAAAGRLGPEQMIAQSADGSVKVYEQAMSEPDREASKAAYAGLSLKDFPLEPGYGVALRQMAGAPAFSDMVFLEPSLQIYNLPDTPFLLQQGSDGQVIASFIGVFFDGLESKVPGLASQAAVEVASSSRIGDAEKLKSSLESAGKSARFLPGCLGEVELKLGETGYPVKVDVIGSGSGAGLCEIQNRPLRFTAVLPAQSWHAFLAGDGKIALKAEYQAAVPIVIKKRTIVVENSAIEAAFDERNVPVEELESRLRKTLSEQKVEEVIAKAFGAEAERAMHELIEKLKALYLHADTQKPGSQAIEVAVSESQNVAIATKLTLWPKLRLKAIARADVTRLHEAATVETGLKLTPGMLVTIEASQVEAENRVRNRDEIHYGVASADDVWISNYDHFCTGSPEACMQQGLKDFGHWEYHLWRSQNLAPEAVSYQLSIEPVSSLAADFFSGLEMAVKSGAVRCDFPVTKLDSFVDADKISLIAGVAEECRGVPAGQVPGWSLVNRIKANPVSIPKAVLLQQYNEVSPSSQRNDGTFTYIPHIRFSGSVLVQGLEAYR